MNERVIIRKYNILAESHEGVCSVPEECWGHVDAESSDNAMQKYATNNPEVHFSKDWNCWLWRARKLTAVLAD